MGWLETALGVAAVALAAWLLLFASTPQSRPPRAERPSNATPGEDRDQKQQAD